MKTIQIALLTIVLCSCTSQPDPPQEATTGAQNSQTDQVAENSASARTTARAKSKYICSRQTSTGSHMSKRICRTRKQMEEDRAEAVRILDDTRVLGSQSAQ